MTAVAVVVDCLLVFNGLYVLWLVWCVSFIYWLGSLGLLLRFEWFDAWFCLVFVYYC